MQIHRLPYKTLFFLATLFCSSFCPPFQLPVCVSVSLCLCVCVRDCESCLAVCVRVECFLDQFCNVGVGALSFFTQVHGSEHKDEVERAAALQ